MPSRILSRASGAPFPLISGNFWSGQGGTHPVGSIVFRWASDASGNAYIALSGGATITSGGFFLSGTLGNADAMMIPPGGTYTLPKLAINLSGVLNVYASCDAAASGVGRLWWEVL